MIRTTTSTNRRTFASLAGLALMIATGCGPTSGPSTGTSGGAGGADGGVTTKPNTGSTGSGTGAGAPAGSYDEVSAACAAEALNASKIYYVCDCASGAAPGCVPGNDSNAGTAAAPFQTTEKAISTFNSLAAGEAVVFCRGGAWALPSDMTVFNTNCRAASPCTMREYTPSWASASTPLPLIASTGASHIFSFSDGGNANHDEGYRIHNLKVDMGSGDSSFFFYNDVDDVDVCNVEINGGKVGAYVGGSNANDTAAPAGDGKNERITIRGSYFHNTTQQGFLGSGYTLNVDSNKFDYCGTDSTMYLHSIYIDSQGSNVHVGNNVVTHSTHAPGGQCNGNPIVVHGVQNGLVLEYNTVDFAVGEAAGGCWGIAVDAGYAGQTEGFTNVAIRGNRVTNPGGLGIGLTSCSNCVIEDNLVVQTSGTGIQIPDRTPGSEDQAMQNVTVRSNTIIGSGSITGVQLGAGTGFSLANNAVARTTTGSVNCYSTGSGVTSDYNACFAPGGTITWSTRDAHAVTTDPQFTGTANGDYIPGTSSPLRDAANPTTSSTIDITSAARDSKPDIGAFEAR